MNKELLEYFTNYCKQMDYEFEDEMDLASIIIDEADIIYSEHLSSHRWYDYKFYVAKLGDIIFGYNYYHITGDNSADDMGLDIDLNSFCIVEKKQKTIDYYERIPNEK